MIEQQPRLILVGGAPGAGKTILARRLASDLGLPLLAKDEIKEALYDALGAPDREAAQRIGAAAYEIISLMADRLLMAETGLIIESNFWRGVSETALRPLVARYEERAGRGERHPGHHDEDSVTAVAANLAADRFEPLDLPIPILRVDTTNGYAPDYAAICALATTPPSSTTSSF